MTIRSIPENYPRVTPYLAIDGAAAAIDFYKKAFNATERMRMAAPDGRIGHAEIEIEGGLIMLADAHPEMGFRSPQALGGSPVRIHIYSRTWMPFLRAPLPQVQRLSGLWRTSSTGTDRVSSWTRSGHTWSIATHVEDVSPEEMQRRAARLYG